MRTRRRRVGASGEGKTVPAWSSGSAAGVPSPVGEVESVMSAAIASKAWPWEAESAAQRRLSESYELVLRKRAEERKREQEEVERRKVEINFDLRRAELFGRYVDPLKGAHHAAFRQVFSASANMEFLSLHNEVIWHPFLATVPQPPPATDLGADRLFADLWERVVLVNEFVTTRTPDVLKLIDTERLKRSEARIMLASLSLASACYDHEPWDERRKQLLALGGWC